MLSKEKVLSFLPFWERVKSYKRQDFQKDIIAGLTVAIIALPQSMAYAMIAGVHPKYGLYSAIIPVIMCSLFSSSRFIIAGPTNAISMVIASTMATATVAGTVVSTMPDEYKIGIVFVLAFLVGAIQLGMGLARMGSFLNFISHSVVVGFTAGAGVLIAVNQLKNIFGLKIPSHPEFIETVKDTFLHIKEFNPYALGIGIFTIVFIIGARKISKKIPGPLMSMVVSALIIAVFGFEKYGVKLIGEIPRGFSPISFPPLSFDTVHSLFMPAAAIALLGLIEAISIAKSAANSKGDKIDGNQEFVSQGLSNLSASFFSGIPGSGSFTRTAVNLSSGASTNLAGVYSGIFVATVLLIFSPYARFIPIASLAGILIVIAYGMIDKKAIAFSYRATRADKAVLIATFLSTLFLELEMAVYVGVILSIALFLKKVANPQISLVTPRLSDNKMAPFQEERSCPQIAIFEISGSLFFGAIEEMEKKLLELRTMNQNIYIIRMRGVRILDATGAHALERFLKDVEKNNEHVIFTNMSDSVRHTIENCGLMKEIGEEHITEDSTDAIKIAVLKYADRGICRNCKIKVFKECEESSKQI